jgi:hypothetical protein
MRKLALGLTAFTAFGVIAYWTLVFAKIFPVTELVPGIRTGSCPFRWRMGMSS